MARDDSQPPAGDGARAKGVAGPGDGGPAAPRAPEDGPGRYIQVHRRPPRDGAASAEGSPSPAAPEVSHAPTEPLSGPGGGGSGEDERTVEDPAHPLVGAVVDGRYRIEGVLGSGGVGVVYRAEHVHLRSPVAVKVLGERFGGHDELRTRFEREARAQHRLRHPNIVALSDYGVWEGMPYLTMELLSGETLAARLRREGGLSPETAVGVLRQMLRGLAFAHGEGIVHRDLKPGNVFVVPLPDDPWHVKLLDFGLAKLLDPQAEDARAAADPTLTQAGAVLGTPRYMSPEQASGGRADARSDVYSAGVLFFEMLTGVHPFPARTRAEQLRAHLVSPVPALGAFRPALRSTPGLDAFLGRALAKERGARFPDAGAMAAALDALPTPVATLVDGDATPTPIGGAPRPPAARRGPPRALVGGAALAAVVGIGVLGWLGLDAGADDTGRPAAASAAPAATPPPAEADPDPFAAPLPEQLAQLAEAAAAPGAAGREALRELAQAQARAGDDPRPSLLLARLFFERGWWSDAIERYTLAARLDAGARGDPSMRAHLVELAGKPDPVGERAVDALVDIYGAGIRPDLDRALGGASPKAARRYRAALARLPTRGQ